MQVSHQKRPKGNFRTKEKGLAPFVIRNKTEYANKYSDFPSVSNTRSTMRTCTVMPSAI